MPQERLIDSIRKRIGAEASLIDEIAGVLDISYDAAHRRVSMKSKFSIEEAVQLANHYGLSMDKLFQGSDRILVSKTKDVRNFEDLSRYLESSYKYLTVHAADRDTELFYSAKDIPLFYTINSDLLSKFKLYVWLYLLNFDDLGMSFDAFQPKAPVVDQGQRMNQLYAAVQTNEIWNDSTINSTLQQISYFFQSGLLSAADGQALCESLKELVSRLEQQCADRNDQYRLYYHEMHILNNNVLISDPHKKSLFVPYTMLGYYITNDEETCNTAYSFFQYQLKNSKLLNTAGVKDRNMFFNRVYRKIDYYKDQMTAFPDMM